MLYHRARVGRALCTHGAVVLLRLTTQGLLLMGAIFKGTVPDETDEERRELERYVWNLTLTGDDITESSIS